MGKRNFGDVPMNTECLSFDTEVLTSAGWVQAKLLSESDRIASYPIMGGQVSYDPPIALRMITGMQMAQITGVLKDEVVSHSHRIDIDRSLRPIHDFMDSTIDAIRFRYSLSSHDGPGIPLTYEQIRLCAWVIFESNIVQHTEVGRIIRFNLKETHKYNRLSDVLMSTGLPHRKSPKSSIISLTGETAELVYSFIDSKKTIPDSWMSINNDQFSVFLSEIERIRGKSPLNAHTVEMHYRNEAERFQLISALHGVPCTIRVETGRDRPKNSKTRGTRFVLKFHWKECAPSGAVTITDLNRRDKVIAIQTVNGTLITRRNGVVNFTGNCRILSDLPTHP